VLTIPRHKPVNAITMGRYRIPGIEKMLVWLAARAA
jgi:hypothetical protein